MDGKNSELEKLQASIEATEQHNTDDPHDAWDADAFKATLESQPTEPVMSVSPEPAPMPPASTEAMALNKAVEDVKEGDVSSIASRKVVYGAARDAMVQRQEFGVAALQAVDSDRQPAAPDTPPSAPTPEQPTTPEQAALETAKRESREARERSEEIEKEYNDKYKAHVLEQSKGLNYFKNMPRRMFGIQPRLTPELEALQGASIVARRQRQEAAQKLKDAKPVKADESYGHAENVIARYQRMLAYSLVTGIQRQRLETQKAAALEAWHANKLKPVMEQLNKYKYTRIGGMAVGYAVLAGTTGGIGAAAFGGGAYLARVAAAMGVGAGVGLSGQALYVEPLRKRLREARAKAGDDFFAKDLAALDKEMSTLTYGVSSREAHVRLATMAAGLGTGAAAGYAGSLAGGEAVPVAGTDISISEGVPVATSTIFEPGGTVIGTTPETPIFEPGGTMEDMSHAVPATPATPVAPEATTDVEQPVSTNEVEQPLPADQLLQSAPPESAEPPESVPMESAAPGYTVVKGDNVWNILQGKWLNGELVGGHSEVLPRLSPAEQDVLLDRAVEYYEQHPAEAEAIGVVKSGGNIHRIYPGEQLDIAAFDEKLREIESQLGGSGAVSPGTQGEVALPETVPVPELKPDLSTPAEAPLPEARPYVASVEPTAAPAPAEALVNDINAMTVQDVFDLQQAVARGDAAAVARLGALGMDAPALQEVVNNIFERGPGDINSSLTVEQYLNTVPAPAASTMPVPDASATQPPVPETTPYGSYDPFQNGAAQVQEASATAEAGSAALQAYVADVEKATRGFLFTGEPDVSGTFDRIKDLSFGAIKELAAADQLPEGVSEDGWSRWVDKVNESVRQVPAAGESETLGQYVARLAAMRNA